MDKIKIEDLLVVEGKTDKAFLLEFIDAKIIETNGSAISRETIQTIKEFSNLYPVIVITDPDYPGDQIRNKIAQAVPGVKHLYLQKDHCLGAGKVGLAQSSPEYILSEITKVITPPRNHAQTISMSNLYELGLLGGSRSSILREKLSRKLSLGKTNGKTLHQRLNWLQISPEKLKDLLKEELYAK